MTDCKIPTSHVWNFQILMVQVSILDWNVEIIRSNPVLFMTFILRRSYVNWCTVFSMDLSGICYSLLVKWSNGGKKEKKRKGRWETNYIEGCWQWKSYKEKAWMSTAYQNEILLIFTWYLFSTPTPYFFFNLLFFPFATVQRFLLRDHYWVRRP